MTYALCGRLGFCAGTWSCAARIRGNQTKSKVELLYIWVLILAAKVYDDVALWLWHLAFVVFFLLKTYP